MLIIRGIPKTVIFNFRYLPFRDAIRFPFVLSHRVVLQRMSGNVQLVGKVRFNRVRIGFHENPQFDHEKNRAVWNNRGTVIFRGTAFLGNGSSISNTGSLDLGDNFQMSGNSSIVCKEDIAFGEDCLIAWGCTFLDGDAHSIYSLESGEKVNGNRPIRIGNHVWFGMNCVVLKGAQIGNGCVVAANSCVTRVVPGENAVVGGNPTRVIKEKIRWES